MASFMAVAPEARERSGLVTRLLARNRLRGRFQGVLEAEIDDRLVLFNVVVSFEAFERLC
jgi:hypothetical protein